MLTPWVDAMSRARQHVLSACPHAVPHLSHPAPPSSLPAAASAAHTRTPHASSHLSHRLTRGHTRSLLNLHAPRTLSHMPIELCTAFDAMLPSSPFTPLTPTPRVATMSLFSDSKSSFTLASAASSTCADSIRGGGKRRGVSKNGSVAGVAAWQRGKQATHGPPARVRAAHRLRTGRHVALLQLGAELERLIVRGGDGARLGVRVALGELYTGIKREASAGAAARQASTSRVSAAGLSRGFEPRV